MKLFADKIRNRECDVKQPKEHCSKVLEVSGFGMDGKNDYKFNTGDDEPDVPLLDENSGMMNGLGET